MNVQDEKTSVYKKPVLIRLSIVRQTSKVKQSTIVEKKANSNETQKPSGTGEDIGPGPYVGNNANEARS